MTIERELLETYEGKDVYQFTLKNKNIEIHILNYGGIVKNILMPDKDGKVEDISLGYDTFEEYKKDDLYFGGIVGRYAGRIAGGQFTVDGTTYNLTNNNGPNTNHGGVKGFNKRVWDSKIENNRLVLSYVSPDGEEHFPGELSVTVTYELTDENELVMKYSARTTKPTVINLTNHAYFNLAGQATGNLNNHMIRLAADKYLPIDATSVPTGVIADVKGTKFDLTTETDLGERIPEVPGDIGFDHTFCLEKSGWKKHAARVVHTPSGRTLDMHTTEPGMQLYTAFYIDGKPGKGGIIYKKFGGFTTEAQHYPNSPNEPSFPNTVLRPGEEYTQETIYKFSIAS